MKKHLQVEGKSQYADDIHEVYRSSACGPVTAFVLLKHLLKKDKWTVNELYAQLGCTKIGLFTWRFIRNVRKLLGPSYRVEKCSLAEALAQLQKGRIVALKFDKWFTFHWKGDYTFYYHWVPLIGFEQTEEDVFLYVHDNGTSRSPSMIRKVSYKQNKSICTFVKIEKQ